MSIGMVKSGLNFGAHTCLHRVRWRFLSRSALLFFAALALPSKAGAQLIDPMQNLGQRPELLKDVGIDQKLNDEIPLDLAFRDEHGKTVELAQFFGSKPVILTLVYYNCPMLCTQVLNGLGSHAEADSRWRSARISTW